MKTVTVVAISVAATIATLVAIRQVGYGPKIGLAPKTP